MGVAVRSRAAVSRSPLMLAASAETVSPDGANPCPEIDCLRPLLPASRIEAAERRALALGTGADRVLITAGALSEEAYLRALAKALGVPFEPLQGVPRTACPLDDERLIESAAAGMLPLTADGGLCLVVAPRGFAARRIAQLIGQNPARRAHFRFTSAERLNRFVLQHAGRTLGARAAGELQRRWPTLSAAPQRRPVSATSAALLALPALIAAVFAPTSFMLGVEIALAAFFLAWLGLRLVGALADWLVSGQSTRLPDRALPVYTIIAALYREAASVDGLLRAIERLDYPAEKLDVIMAVEADDRDTRAAIARHAKRLPITLIPVPAEGPRTKPKALNVALPFARGAFTVVYDAEDRPEPGQLRRALQAFRKGGDDLVCVQARLCIDNTADSWLARLFTAEYAAQFDVFLPGFAALGVPLPLGGSSNHFHTAALRALGGWDPYNVTEDADLGIRLARFGRRSSVIESTTYEEAPARFAPWLRQRTRWFKGWMQTWLVHMRRPARLLHDLGLAGFLAFQLVVGGNVLAALVHPLFLGTVVVAAASGEPIWHTGGLAAVYGTTAIAGYLSSAFLGWLGLSRRGLAATGWVLLLTPVHWLALSLAAWRALYQLITAPYRWEKTEHGLAKSSRRVANLTRSLLQLERDLAALQRDGRLPATRP